MNETVKWLNEWFKKNGRFVPGETDNYFDVGGIDSMSVIGLINDVEKHFEISFSQEHFQDRRFATIDGLSLLIDEISENRNS